MSVMILTLSDPATSRDDPATVHDPATVNDPATINDSAGCGGACGCGDGPKARVPVLACADALRAGGADVELVTACSDAEIDAVVKMVEAGEAQLIVAAATDSELRGVVRRFVRRYAPPPSKRPAELPPDRTVFDLPPMSVLPLLPAVPDLVGLLNLPTDPATVAATVLRGQTRRLDLLRNDGGSVTLGGALIGGLDDSGTLGAWQGQVAVDDVILSDGDEPIFACSIRNVGPSTIDGLPLVTGADPADGRIEVAIAIPILKRRLLRGADVRLEVRRARGRGASVTPRDADIPYVDDGVVATLNRKRSWWVEPGAWATYVM
jgi:hypothetical protein